MNSAIIVVLVLLWGVDCRPVRQDVLAGEDFLAFFMRTHNPRSQQIHFTQATTTSAPSTTVVTTEATTTGTETETVQTTIETEPPSVVSVRVSSSVRKEAVHETPNVIAAAQRSHFSVESSGYREESGEQRAELEDSVAEATHDFPSAHEDGKHDEKKPYAEALTLEESGIGYETRVSSETSQSRIYFSQPKVLSESVVVQTSATRKYDPQSRIINAREDRKLVPHILNESRERRKYNPQPIISQSREEVKYQTQETPSIQTPPYEVQNQIVQQEHNARNYESPIVNQQPEKGTFDVPSQQQRAQRAFETNQDNQQQAERNYETAPVGQERGEINYEEPPVSQQQEERNYEHQEQNYEVDEAISVMTNGRTHGVQTEPPPRKSIGFVQEGKNYRKYRVEEKTPDGFIVGEYGVVSHDDGGVRGVRYTADGSINPRLIYEALVKFLSLK